MRSVLTFVIGVLGLKTSQPLLSPGAEESVVVALPATPLKQPAEVNPDSQLVSVEPDGFDVLAEAVNKSIDQFPTSWFEPATPPDPGPIIARNPSEGSKGCSGQFALESGAKPSGML